MMTREEIQERVQQIQKEKLACDQQVAHWSAQSLRAEGGILMLQDILKKITEEKATEEKATEEKATEKKATEKKANDSHGQQ